MPIADLHVGPVTGLVGLASDLEERQTSKGKPFVAGTLGDAGGVVRMVRWDGGLATLPAGVRDGAAVEVSGRVEEYHGTRQVIVASIVASAVDSATLRAASPVSATALDAGLRQALDTIQHPVLRAVAEDVTRGAGFAGHPAAKRLHHATAGGLADHSLCMARAATALKEVYEERHPGMVDWDLVVCGALLHDAGKMEEMTPEGEYTEVGQMLGHVAVGYERATRALAAAWEANPEVSEDPSLNRALLHLVLSHHGEREKGAPVHPRTAEAVVLHYLDELDSRLGGLEVLARGANGAEWVEGGLMFGPGKVRVAKRSAAKMPF